MVPNNDADKTENHLAVSPTGDPRNTIGSRKELDQCRERKEDRDPVSIATHDLTAVASRYAERATLELGEYVDPRDVFAELNMGESDQ